MGMSVVALSHVAVASTDTCSTVPADKDKVARTMRQLFASTSVADTAGVQRVLTSDFYAFDGVQRVDKAGLIRFSRSAIDAGKHYTWTVSVPDFHLTRHGAWIASTNRGSVQEPSAQWIGSGSSLR